MTKIRKLLFGYGLFFAAMILGVVVTIVAQDAQRLQKEKETLALQMQINAERIRVLEAEWAYLTRPDHLLATMQRAEPNAGWMPVSGEKMVSMDEFMATQPAQVANATHDAPKVQ